VQGRQEDVDHRHDFEGAEVGSKGILMRLAAFTCCTVLLLAGQPVAAAVSIPFVGDDGGTFLRVRVSVSDGVDTVEAFNVILAPTGGMAYPLDEVSRPTRHWTT